MTRGFVGIAALLTGCAALQSPALAPDVANELACIQAQAEKGATDPVAIGLACGGAEVLLVTDLLAALVSGQWGKAHPALTPPLRESIQSFRLSHEGHS
jgi:hypothetical protein